MKDEEQMNRYVQLLIKYDKKQKRHGHKSLVSQEVKRQTENWANLLWNQAFRMSVQQKIKNKYSFPKKIVIDKPVQLNGSNKKERKGSFILNENRSKIQIFSINKVEKKQKMYNFKINGKSKDKKQSLVDQHTGCSGSQNIQILEFRQMGYEKMSSGNQLKSESRKTEMTRLQQKENISYNTKSLIKNINRSKKFNLFSKKKNLFYLKKIGKDEKQNAMKSNEICIQDNSRKIKLKYLNLDKIKPINMKCEQSFEQKIHDSQWKNSYSKAKTETSYQTKQNFHSIFQQFLRDKSIKKSKLSNQKCYQDDIIIDGWKIDTEDQEI